MSTRPEYNVQQQPGYTGAPVDLAGAALASTVQLDESLRIKSYAAQVAAYQGHHPRAIRQPRQGEPDDNVVVNYARIIVDKGAAFLFGGDLGIELDTEANAGDAVPENLEGVDDADRESPETPEGAALDTFWEANGDQLTRLKLAVNGGICGHAWAKLWPTGVPGEAPRLMVVDPSTVSVVWDADDYETVSRYVLTWNTYLPGSRRPIRRRQLMDRTDAGTWLITDQQARGVSSWETLEVQEWPYPWAPLLGCQNLPQPNEYYGEADLSPDVLHLNYAINRVTANINRILRLHAHPKYVGIGMGTGGLSLSADEILNVPNPEAKLQALEMQSDLGSSIGYLDVLRQALHEIARVPEVATGRLAGIGNLSGTALSILYGPIVEKTEAKRRTYGPLVQQLSAHALELMGVSGYTPDDVVLHWPELVPLDPMQERQAALIDKQLGVSDDTLMEKLGYRPDLERERRQYDVASVGAGLMGAFDAGTGADGAGGGAGTGPAPADAG